jgi:hypothetical protein
VHPATVIASESEAIQLFSAKNWIASSQVLLAMTKVRPPAAAILWVPLKLRLSLSAPDD